MAGWHHQLDGCEFEWIPGDGDGERGLACCDAWGRKESDTTERLNWTEIRMTFLSWVLFCSYHCDHHPSVINNFYSHCPHAPVWKPLSASLLTVWGILGVTLSMWQALVGPFDQLAVERVVIWPVPSCHSEIYSYPLVGSCQPCLLSSSFLVPSFLFMGLGASSFYFLHFCNFGFIFFSTVTSGWKKKNEVT